MATRQDAEKALRALLMELPAEFSGPVDEVGRESFSVIKRSNVRTVHEALLVLQHYLGV